MLIDRGDYFLFGFIFIKKIIKLNFFKKKPKPNRNRFKLTGFSSVRFLEQKPVQTGLTRFFPVWLGFGLVFSGLARFFSCFFWFGFGFGFFGFKLIKPKPNWTGQFFQNFNRFNLFFSRLGFFGYCFSGFLSFSILLLTTTYLEHFLKKSSVKKIHKNIVISIKTQNSYFCNIK